MNRPGPPARLALRLIGWYQMGISPLLPPTCRYSPSCSEYAFTAVERFGLLRGGAMALRRLLRCGPWHRGGFDPVPERRGRPEASVPVCLTFAQTESVRPEPTPPDAAVPVRLTAPELEPQL